MQNNGTVVVLAAAMLLSGCDRSPGADAENDADKETAAIPVEVARPVRGDIYQTHTGTAAIEAFAEALVVAKVGGEIREVLAEEGDEVEAGQLLARLDGDRLRLDVAQSEARLQKLKRDYQRNLDLKERGLISAGDFEAIQYEMEALEATWNLAKLELSYTEILAPIDGVVAERLVKKGNTIDVNAPMFQVTSLEPLVSYLHVPEREYRRIDSGMSVSLAVDALPDVSFDATVARVGPVVDPDTGTFKITIEVSDPSRRLKPGMFARIIIVADMHADALQVPRNAIVEDGGDSVVFIVEDSTAEKRPVRTGFVSNGRVEITEGLAGDEAVIVVGNTGLRNGSKVLVVNGAERDATSVAVSADAANDES